MAIRALKIQSSPSTITLRFARSQNYTRQIHQQVSARDIPSPTPFVPDSKTFLSLIGRNLSQHAAKIPSWESLFSLTSAQLRELGIEPARNRRYLLWWRDKFRKGIYGIGGDLQNVVDGTAELRAVEVPFRKTLRNPMHSGLELKKKLVVNMPPGALVDETITKELAPVKGMKVVGAHTIIGPHVQLVKGSNGSVAKIKIQDKMWEEKRGHKVDGGERRKAQVRHNKRMEENRKRK